MRLDIVTPDRRLNSLKNEDVRLPCEASSVLIPGKDGEFEVLPNHAPFITVLGTGLLSFRTESGQEVKLMVSGGFAEIDRDIVTVMCEAAALPEEVEADLERKALAAAEKQLGQLGAVAREDEDFKRLRAETERAASKLNLIR